MPAPGALDIPQPVVDDRKQTLNLAQLKAWADETGESFADLYDRVGDLEVAPPGHAASHKPQTGTDPLATGTASTLSGTNAAGTADALARQDHNHAFPVWGTTYGGNFINAPASTAMLANFTYAATLRVFHKMNINGIGFLSVSAVGNCRVSLYNALGGQVANSNSTAVAGAFQNVAFPSTYAADPGLYYVGFTFSGTPQVVAALYDRGSLTAGPGAGASAAPITVPTNALTVPTFFAYL